MPIPSPKGKQEYLIDYTNQIKELTLAKAPTPTPDETHEKFMKRCIDKGHTRDECMKAHKGHTFKGK